MALISRPSWMPRTLRTLRNACPLKGRLGLCAISSSASLNGERKPLSAANIEFTPASEQKPLTPNDKLVFGHTFTDHMMRIEWNSAEGWKAPNIGPYRDISMDPATCVLHYGFECFEGLKAYRGVDGEVRLFRPDKNMARFSRSSRRIALPEFDQKAMQDALVEFVRREQRWVPEGFGYSLYLRPTHIGMQKTLGVGPVSSSMVFVIASPVGPYYKSGFKAVKLYATQEMMRAWPGGVGNAKVGGNYAPGIVPQEMAAEKGYAQILWLFGPEDKVTEVGTMNCFACLVNEAGEKELVTAPLDGMILDGVVRDSVLELARERLAPEGWRVSERYFSMPEIAAAAASGRLLEMFGTGTAALISPISAVHYMGQDIPVPLQDGKEAGPVAERLNRWIMDIQYGKESHGNWTVKVGSE